MDDPLLTVHCPHPIPKFYCFICPSPLSPSHLQAETNVGQTILLSDQALSSLCIKPVVCVSLWILKITFFLLSSLQSLQNFSTWAIRIFLINLSHRVTSLIRILTTLLTYLQERCGRHCMFWLQAPRWPLLLLLLLLPLLWPLLSTLFFNTVGTNHPSSISQGFCTFSMTQNGLPLYIWLLYKCDPLSEDIPHQILSCCDSWVTIAVITF